MTDSVNGAAVREAIRRDDELSSGKISGLSHEEVIQAAKHALSEIQTLSKKAYHQGDAFELVADIPDASVDLILTSPPYWGQRSYGLTHNWDILKEWKQQTGGDGSPSYSWYREHGGVLGLEPKPDWYVTHLVEFFQKAKNKLKDSGSLWVNIGDTYFARWASIRDEGRQGLGNNPRIRRRTPMGGYLQEKQMLLIPARLGIAMQEQRWILRNDLIWFKPNVPPRPEKDRLRLSHEHFFHFVKRPREGRAKYYYDMSSVENGEFDVIKCFVRRGKNGHSATFPEELISNRILSSSPPGGIVLDPFCGTGSAVECAARLGRNAIGFELVSRFLPKK
jgi:site-specific DNA-methyltransferase (cytosine-N4-specific)